MAQPVARYEKPADTAAFDDDHACTHVPLARKIDGLRRWRVSTC